MMACLFLQNIPPEVFWKGNAIKVCLDECKKAGVILEIHTTNVTYSLLTANGEEDALQHGVHGFLFLHAGCAASEKQAVGDAIRLMLAKHGLEEGFDLTFIEGKRGETFYYLSTMVS